jgi:hypothetical protein
LVRELFLEALELPTGAEQAALLDRVADRSLREKVESPSGQLPGERGLFEEPVIVGAPDRPASVSVPPKPSAPGLVATRSSNKSAKADSGLSTSLNRRNPSAGTLPSRSSSSGWTPAR